MLVMLYMVMEIQQSRMLHHFAHLQNLLKTPSLAIQMPSLSHLPAAWIPLFNSWCMVKIRIPQLQMPMDFAASKVDKLCRKIWELLEHLYLDSEMRILERKQRNSQIGSDQLELLGHWRNHYTPGLKIL